MKRIKFRLAGIAPLLMHSAKAADPLNDYAKIMKKLTSKRNKTEDDLLFISRVEWESGLYMADGVVVIPDENIYRCFWEGAKKSKNGVKWQAGAIIPDDYAVLNYDGPKIKTNGSSDIPNPDLDKFFPRHSFRCLVKVGPSRVLRTRPIFYNWSLDVVVQYNENLIETDTVISTVKDAGDQVGMMEKRPRIGRFTTEVLEQS